jgi:hypothetical protein
MDVNKAKQKAENLFMEKSFDIKKKILKTKV